MAIILCDFDGTIVPQVPEGYCDVDTGAERVLKKLIDAGHLIVLWTCRNNSKSNPYNYTNGRFRDETSLEEAVRWFIDRNIPLYGVNEVPNEKSLVGVSRKILGDLLIDDTCIGIPIVWGDVTYVSYETGEFIYNYRTYSVDWMAIEALLRQRKLIL